MQEPIDCESTRTRRLCHRWDKVDEVYEVAYWCLDRLKKVGG